MARLRDETREAFCRTYVGRGKRNAWRSAEMVGIHPGTAAAWMVATEGPGVEVQARIVELGDALLKSTDITAQRVMMELGRLAFADVRAVYAEGGELHHPHDMDDDAAAAVSSIEHKVELTPGPKQLDLVTGKMVATTIPVRVTKIKRFDKNPALQTLAKHFKLIGDEGDGVNALASALADRLKAARGRVAPAPNEPQGGEGS